MLIWVYRVALFVAATFVFVVLFDRGAADFPRKLGEEFRAAVDWAQNRGNPAPAR